MPGKMARSGPPTPVGRPGMTATGRSSNWPSKQFRIGIPFISARVHLGGSRTGGRGRGSVSRSRILIARPHLPPGSGPAPPRRRARTAGQARAEGPAGAARSTGPPFGDLRQSQQALRERLNKLLEELKNRGFGPNQQGKPGQGQQQGQGQGDMNEPRPRRRRCGRDRDLVPSAGCIDCGRLGQPRAQQETDPLGRPLHGREYGDDYTVKVPRDRRAARAPHHRGTAPPLTRHARSESFVSTMVLTLRSVPPTTAAFAGSPSSP